MYKVLLPLLLAVGLTSCGSKEDNSDLSIFGGHASGPGNWPTAVALVKSGRVDCTGTLVHPKLVITAAHCVEGWVNSIVLTKTMGVYIGNGIDGGIVEPQYKIVRAALHPLYKKHISGAADAAYLILDKPVENVPLIPILTNLTERKELLDTNKKSILVGFGRDETGGFGVKKEVEAPITSINSNEINLGGFGTDSCNGDSGGPLYGRLSTGEWRVFGIVSRGVPNEDGFGVSINGCGQGGIWGLMHDTVCWIQNSSGFEITDSKLDCKPNNTTYSELEIEKFNLLAMSMDPYITKSQKHTIEALKLEANITSSHDIVEAENYLEELILDDKDITDVSPLASLKAIKYLSLRENGLEKIESLQRLTSLKVLDLGKNNIKDFSPLKELEENGLRILGKNLQQSNYLETYFAEICSNVSIDYQHELYPHVLAIKKRVNYSSYSPCKAAIQALATRTTLDLIDVGFTKITPLKGLQNLRTLDLSGNFIADTSDIETVEGLEKLTLDRNNIEELTHIAKSMMLKELSLKNNRITDISALAELKKLKRLDVTDNYIKDFSALKELEEAGLEIIGKEEQGDEVPPLEEDNLPAPPPPITPPAPPSPFDPINPDPFGPIGPGGIIPIFS